MVDCDGVLTDAKVWYDDSGERPDWKRAYSLRDGYGLKKLIDSGFIVGVITASQSKDIRERASSLKIQYFYEGRFEKMVAYEDFKEKTGLKDHEVAYMGDDDPDVPVLKTVGFAATVNDALPSAKKAVHYISSFKGGEGAVRDVCEMILSHAHFFKVKGSKTK